MIMILTIHLLKLTLSIEQYLPSFLALEVLSGSSSEKSWKPVTFNADQSISTRSEFRKPLLVCSKRNTSFPQENFPLTAAILSILKHLLCSLE